MKHNIAFIHAILHWCNIAARGSSFDQLELAINIHDKIESGGLQIHIIDIQTVERLRLITVMSWNLCVIVSGMVWNLDVVIFDRIGYI